MSPHPHRGKAEAYVGTGALQLCCSTNHSPKSVRLRIDCRVIAIHSFVVGGVEENAYAGRPIESITRRIHLG